MEPMKWRSAFGRKNAVRTIALALAVAARSMAIGQVGHVAVSGGLVDAETKAALPYFTITLHDPTDSSLIGGTLSGEDGRWTLEQVLPGDYDLRTGGVGYGTHRERIHVGSLSPHLELGAIPMRPGAVELGEFEVVQHVDEVRGAMDRKVYRLDDNTSQSGGTVLQALRNLPGVTVDQRNGKLQLRGSDKVAVLVDGQQSALTGFGNQSGLDNIPASAIERIEVINDPSAKQDANGMAGIINIIYKKDRREGLHGKASMMAGLGALGAKQADLPTVRPQYSGTPKLGPSLGLNWNRKKVALHLQADLLHQRVLNRDEHFTRTFADGASVRQQYLENRDQTSYTTKLGSDITLNARDALSISALFGREAHIDHGDVVYFDGATSERRRLWQFYEDEVNTSANFATAFTHRYAQPGRRLDIGLNYTFHREDEVYDITDNTATGTGYNNTALIADEHVGDLKLDYTRPTKHGRWEAGGKFRWRNIPTRISYAAGVGSPLDPGAAGGATYNEVIPALYTTYVFEREKDELEAGLRVEHVTLNYTVDPGHNTYSSDGYSYLQPFPNLRYARKVSERSRISASVSRRVDRPDEGDLRIFPKYDDPTILRIGNPGLLPQFTLRGELGYKLEFAKGYGYGAVYHRVTDDILTRIVTGDGSSTQLYTLAQNAGRGTNTGLEVVIDQQLTKSVRLNVNGNLYQNAIDAFSTVSAYPVPTPYTAARQRTTSGNVKVNARSEVRKGLDVQLTGIWQARDIVPQGSIGPRWSVDLGVVRKFPGLRSDLTIAATDLFNTYRIPKVVVGDGFKLVSTDYLESRAVRVTWAWTF
ncbi:MAG: TonB-dependent receptor [Flavobacteriales bacterium]|nr:TonB-dependent receptor [Flavobacteriales bacterium]